MKNDSQKKIDSQKETQSDWDVFRYIAEEMSPTEERQFEALLAEDQPLREKVALSVSNMATIDCAIADSKASPAAIHRNEKLRMRRVLATVVALIAVAALAVSLTTQSAVTNDDAESIAIAWAESIESDEFEFEVVKLEDEFAALDFDESQENDWITEVVIAANDGQVEIN